MYTTTSVTRNWEANSLLTSPAAAPEPAFRDYFWTLLVELIPCALEQPATCSELFQLAIALFKSMKESKSDVLDLPRTTQILSRLLLDYKPQEVSILAPTLDSYF